MTRLLKSALICFVCLLALPSFAQNATNKTILVLDASGSMWGQIDGVAKITIAQQVVGELLQSVPADQALGLTAYGHNRKGDCSDIQTLVPPSLNNRGAIAGAVNAISPKGKTPLSAAVLQAARDLQYQEDKATVILISDGRETCDFDPCQVGAELERLGVDFTAHVVGFDVSEESDRAQLRCLAENTGGEFFTASNADELGAALQVVTAPPPAPEPIRVTFVAQEQGTNFYSTENLFWTFQDLGSDGPFFEGQPTAQFSWDLMPGGYYQVDVLRSSDEATASMQVLFDPNMARTQVLTLPPFLPPASVSGPTSAPAGETITVEWTGPAQQGDYIAVAKSSDDAWVRVTAETIVGNAPVQLQMPGELGPYQLRYVMANGQSNGDDVILATQEIMVEEQRATIIAPANANAADTITVEWTGPALTADYISVARPGEDAWLSISFERVANGPVQLLMPGEPGTYELRYVLAVNPNLNGDDQILATQEITIAAQTASVTAPSTAFAGETISVDWTGPAAEGDYISVAELSQDPWNYMYFERLTESGPVGLQMPGQAGTFEIRYVLAVNPNLNGDNEILATAQIQLQMPSVSLAAPESVAAEAPIPVTWTGPAYQGDYVSIAEVGTDPWIAVQRVRVDEGSPLNVTAPKEPGVYELRYVMELGTRNGDNTVIATRNITVQ